MPKKQTTADFAEIFEFAKEKYGWEWNYCCDIFHRGRILVNDEDKDKSFDLDELEYVLEEKYYKGEILEGYEIVKEFMLENNLTEMRVLND